MENYPDPGPGLGNRDEPDLVGGVVDVVAQDARRRRAWPALALLVVLVMGSAAAYADQRDRAQEAAAVGACEHSLRVASALSELRMGLLANYVRPARRTPGGVQQLHLADLMAARAGRVLPGVQRADRVCRAVTVRPWHFSLVARRDAARAYSGALVTLLQTVAAQGRRPFHDDATLVLLRAGAGAD
jgi:hypothetical protein